MDDKLTLGQIVKAAQRGETEEVLDQFINMTQQDVYMLMMLIANDDSVVRPFVAQACRDLLTRISLEKEVVDLDDFFCRAVTGFFYKNVPMPQSKEQYAAKQDGEYYSFDKLMDDSELHVYLYSQMQKDKSYLSALYQNMSVTNRVIFQLFCLAGASVEEIAQDIERDLNEVRSRLQTIRSEILDPVIHMSEENVEEGIENTAPMPLDEEMDDYDSNDTNAEMTDTANDSVENRKEIKFKSSQKHGKKSSKIHFDLFLTAKKREEIGDEIDDLEMELYYSRCRLEEAEKTGNHRLAEHEEKKIDSLELQIEGLKKRLR